MAYVVTRSPVYYLGFCSSTLFSAFKRDAFSTPTEHVQRLLLWHVDVFNLTIYSVTINTVVTLLCSV